MRTIEEIDVRLLVKKLLDGDLVKTIAFVRARNFGMTEIELEEALRILTGKENLIGIDGQRNDTTILDEARKLGKIFPEVYPIINKTIS